MPFADPDTDQVYAFWRPHAPPGFAVLGDYLTPLLVKAAGLLVIFISLISFMYWYNWFLHHRDKPPTRGVLVVNTNVVRVKRALSFRLIWPPSSGSEGISNEPVTVSSSENGDLENECSVWFPEAPKGYVALGCVVSQGRTQPSRSSTFCILASLVSPCSLRDCVTISSRNMYVELSLHYFRKFDMHVRTYVPLCNDWLKRTCVFIHAWKKLPTHVYVKVSSISFIRSIFHFTYIYKH